MKKFGIILLLAVFSTGSAMAQLIQVDQEVFGMDCAPCAYGLERGLKKIDGVEKVKVSLNDGKAYLSLAPANNLTLKKIQEEVKKNGFSARNAEVILKGNLIEAKGHWQIGLKNELFNVTDGTGAEILKALKSGMLIKVKGEVMDRPDNQLSNKWNIRITEILQEQMVSVFVITTIKSEQKNLLPRNKEEESLLFICLK